jgi:hypothetical protein
MMKFTTLAILATAIFVLFSHHNFAASARTSVAAGLDAVAGVLSAGPVAIPNVALPSTAAISPAKTLPVALAQQSTQK